MGYLSFIRLKCPERWATEEMNSPYFWVVVAVIVAVIGGWYVHKRVEIPISSHELKMRKTHRQQRKDRIVESMYQRNTRKVMDRYRLFIKIPGIKLTAFKREDYNRLIVVSNKMLDGKLILAEDLFVQCCTRGMRYVLIVVAVAVFFHPAIIALAVLPVIAHKPISDLNESIEANSSEIRSQITDFYNMYYCQFRQEHPTLPLIDVCQNFTPIANHSMKTLLERFISDLEVNEEKALMDLSKRYRHISEVNEIVVVMLGRMRGDFSSIIALDSLMSKIRQRRIDKADKINDRNRVVLNSITYAMLVILLFTILGVYFTSQSQ